MGKILTVIFVSAVILAGVAQGQEALPTVIGCVDVTHSNHGLWYYTLQVQRVSETAQGILDQIVLTTPAQGTIAGGSPSVTFQDVEEIKEASSLTLVGRGIRIEISETPYYQDTYSANVTLSSGDYSFKNVTYACHFHQN